MFVKGTGFAVFAVKAMLSLLLLTYQSKREDERERESFRCGETIKLRLQISSSGDVRGGIMKKSKKKTKLTMIIENKFLLLSVL